MHGNLQTMIMPYEAKSTEAVVGKTNTN